MKALRSNDPSQWFQYILLNYFEEKGGDAFNRMMKRKNGKVESMIANFHNCEIMNIDGQNKFILVFYKTEYERSYYRFVYTMKKVTRPFLSPPSPIPETQPITIKKINGKTENKAVKKNRNHNEDEIRGTRSFNEGMDVEPERAPNVIEDHEKGKRKKNIENKSRPQSPATVIELGPQLETEHVYQKVLTIVKKRKKTTQFHCCSKPIISSKYKNNIQNTVCIMRNSTKAIPKFDTYEEVISELPKYTIISFINTHDYTRFCRKILKVLKKHVETTFAEPNMEKEESETHLERVYKRYYKISNLLLPNDSFHLGTDDFYYAYYKAFRKLQCEFYRDKEIMDFSWHGMSTDIQTFTLRNILSASLYTMKEEHLITLFRNIREKNEIKLIDLNELEEKPFSPLKEILKNQLKLLIDKLNWCRQHLESDLDIEVLPCLEAEQLCDLPKDEILKKTDIIDKIGKKLEIWGRYISTVLARCKVKKPKGSGPSGEYEYWSKRKDQLGPLLFTFYSKSVSKLVYILKKIGSSEVHKFTAKRLSLKKYYETATINKNYISMCMYNLEKINGARDLEEINAIIPEFWKNMRHLWLISGYWSMTSNIIGFIERVQYMIVKKCIKVLEVHNFFLIPQITAKQLAQDVIEVMGIWKSSFYDVKAYIELHKWEMRWNFPLHRIFTVTDYMAKLAKDFCFIAESIKDYLDIFSNELAKVVKDEIVIHTFSQRVKSMTMPLRSADFNIYDPDNDVHWNLLMETFLRDLSSIEYESIHIINQTFNNLRSSMNATNFIIRFKENLKKNKCYALLMSKFDFIILQIFKEIRLISELTSNTFSCTPCYQFFNIKNLSKLYWIRQQSICLQFRFLYLNQFDEVKSTNTFHRAITCFNNITTFYEICELIIYCNWISTERKNISSQLIKNVFRLKAIQSSFVDENQQIIANNFKMDGETDKVIRKPKVKEHSAYQKEHNIRYAKHTQSNKIIDKKSINGVMKRNATTSNEKEAYLKNNATVNELTSDHPLEDNSRKLSALKQQFMALLNEERKCLNHYKKDSKTSEDVKQLHSEFPIHTERKSNLSYCLPSCLYMLPSSSTHQHCSIVKEMIKLAEKIFSIPSFKDEKSNFAQKLTTSCHIPLKNLYTELKREPSEMSSKCTFATTKLIARNCHFVYDSLTHMVLAEYLLFKTSSRESLDGSNIFNNYFKWNEFLNIFEHQVNSPTGTLRLVKREIDVLFKIFQNDVADNVINEIFKSKDCYKINQNQRGDDHSSSIIVHHCCFDKEQRSTKERLLVERGFLTDINFDFHYCNILMEISHITKLGLSLSGKFYGLLLLKDKLLNDIKKLNSIVARYTSLILSLKKEELSSLKIYIYEFEYILIKGVNYYTWYTVNADSFCDKLNTKMNFLYSFKENIWNVTRAIHIILLHVKNIDWFPFPEQRDETNFKTIKELFETLKERRKDASNDMLALFFKITPLLRKLECIILGGNSGKEKYLVLFYKYFEEKILQALVINFLRNLEKFKSFLLGNEREKFQITITTIPDVVFDFQEDQCYNLLTKSLDHFLSRYRKIKRWQPNSCLECKDSFQKRSYLEDLLKFKIIATEIVVIRQLICEVTCTISGYLDRWKHYKHLWVYDKVSSIEYLFSNTNKLVEYCVVFFFFYDKFINELKCARSYLDLYCARIQINQAITEMLHHTLEWKYILKCKLLELARSQVLKLNRILSGMHYVLTQRVQNLDEFQDVLKVINDIVGFNCDYDTSISIMNQVRYILVRHGMKFSRKDCKLLNEIRYFHSTVKKNTKYKLYLISYMKRLYRKMSQDLISDFAVQCESFADSYYKEGPGTVGKELDLGISLIKKFRAEFEIYNSRKEIMIQTEQLFEHDPVSYEYYENAYQEFTSLEVVFELYNAQKVTREEWANISWIYLEEEMLIHGIDAFLLQYNQMPYKIRKLPVSKEIKQNMEHFKVSVFLMVNLKNDALKERHWKELMIKTGHIFDLSPSKFTLRDLFLMDLHLHEDTVTDIIGKAERELNVEISIIAVRRYWERQNFKWSVINKQYILEEIGTIIRTLEDYCIDLEKMSYSQFAIPFLEEIKSWEKKLSYLYEMLTNMSILQNNILCFNNIFDEKMVQKKLPDVHKQYVNIQKQYSKTIKSFIAKPSILEQCLKQGYLSYIGNLISRLENCKSSLNEYLSSERIHFPRLYLLADDEMYPLLNKPNISHINNVLPKIFQNVSSLTISTMKNENFVTGMVSIQGEVIHFRKQIHITKFVPLGMNTVTQEMKKTVKYNIKMTIHRYASLLQTRSDWIMTNAGVSTLAASKVWWTAEVEYVFTLLKQGESKAMKKYMNKLKKREDELFLALQRPLGSMERLKHINIFLLDFHGKGVVDKLINESVINENSFEWESQLKFYWIKSSGTLRIKQSSGEYEYGYEYKGLTERLVITPFTERVFLSLTQAFLQHFTACIIGPSSTGKTATVKDLSNIFSIFCVIINCGCIMNINALNNLFSAVCNEGLWGCFDNFNLIDVSIISKITTYLSAIRRSSITSATTVNLNGCELTFDRNTEIILSLNNVYFSNKCLPESIKLLLRPVVCAMPSIEDISFAMLLSVGFSNAKVLSKKVARLYEVANDVLFSNEQNNFSLQSLKSFLKKCGTYRRNDPDIEEEVVLVKALRETNQSTLSSKDDDIFISLIKDIFPSVECPNIIYSQFEKAIEEVWLQTGIVFIPKLMEKVVQTYEIVKIRRSVALVGPTGGGKTVIVNTLCSVQSATGQQSKVIKINPMAYSNSELFGYYDEYLLEWSDGLVTKIFRELNKDGEQGSHNYIFFDGDIVNSWIENMNLLMDDNRVLMLANNERIYLAENCFFLFEVGSLENVSPAVSCRLGVVYVEAQQLGYRPYWKRWIQSRVDKKMIKLFNKNFEKYVPLSMSFIYEAQDHKSVLMVIPQTPLNLVIQLCFILESLVPIVDTHDNTNLEKKELAASSAMDENGDIENEIESVFILSIYLSLGACLSLKGREAFDGFMKNIIDFKMFNDTKEEKAMFGTLPTRMDTLYGYNIDRKLNCWVAWEDSVEPYVLNQFTSFDEIIVPTTESNRMVWIMKLINEHNVTEIVYRSLKYKTKVQRKKKRPVILVGGSSSTKTTILQEFARHLNLDDYDHLNLNFSTSLETHQIQASLEGSLENYTEFVCRPKERKKLIIFIDDLNFCQNVSNSMERHKHFLKMLIENKGMYTRDGNFTWKRIEDLYFYSAMGIPRDSIGYEEQRFLSLFSIFYIPLPSNEAIKTIFSSIIEAHTSSFAEGVKKIIPDLVSATLKIYQFTVSNLLPTPSKFHYMYNLKDLSQITKGLLQTSQHLFKRPEQMIRVWRNEVTRVLWDRLVSKDEQNLVRTEMKATIETFFPNSIDYVMQDPLLFGDYRNAIQRSETRVYEDLLDYEAVYHLFTEILQEISINDPKTEVVLFEEFLDHLTRIHRILRMYRGHAMIIGPVGSGKQTVVRLASYTAGCKLSEVVRKCYRKSEFEIEIKQLLHSMLVHDQKTTLTIMHQQTEVEGVLEILSEIISSQQPLSIFNKNDITAIMNDIQTINNSIGSPPLHLSNIDQSLIYLERKCKELLHIVLLMTLSMDSLRRKSYDHPGLISNVTIDWINPWPSEALYAVAKRFLKETKCVPEKFKDSIVEVMVYVHETARDYLKRMEVLSFQAYVTPKHYLDFIKVYLKLVDEKQNQIIQKCIVLEGAIKKVDEGNEDLKALNIKIDAQKSIVEEKKHTCTTFVSEIGKVSNELDIKKKILEEKRKKNEILLKELAQHLEEVENIIKKSMEGIHDAIKSIKMIDLMEMKTLSTQDNPPESTVIICECVFILMGKTDVKWKNTRDLLCEAGFISSLEGIDVTQVHMEQQKQVRGRLKRLSKILVSSTCSEIEEKYLRFVEVLLHCCNVLRECKPKQDRIEDLNCETNQAQNSLNSIILEIEQKETVLKMINEKNEKAMEDKNRAQQELETSRRMLMAVDKLITGLYCHYSGWLTELNSLRLEKQKVVGNSLISASFLVYCGILSYEVRIESMKLWTDFLKGKKIPISLPLKLEDELANSVTLNKWLAEGLSDNDWSMQNAMLFSHSNKIPLCIDPKEQVLNWMMKKHENNKLEIFSYNDPRFEELLEVNIKSKSPFFLKDIDLIDSHNLRIIESHEGSHCVGMATRSIRPQFDPTIFSCTTVINFTENKMELEDNILDKVLEHEHKDIWDQRKELIMSRFKINEKLSKLQMSLVLEVEKKESGLLENVEKIEKLSELKILIEEMRSQQEAAENSLIENNNLRNMYLPVSKSGTILYFVLAEMYKVNSMYEISIKLFFDMMDCFLENIKPKLPEELEERIQCLIKFMKKFFYEFQCRGTYAHHQLLFSLIMAMYFQKNDGILSEKEIDFFINGNKKVDPTMQSPIDWISQKGWQDLQTLSSEFPNDFSGIVNHITSHNKQWNKWLNLNHSLKIDLPLPFNNLTTFKKLMLLRCIHPSIIYNFIGEYIVNAIEDEFTTRSFTLLDDVFKQTSSRRSVIYIMTPQADSYTSIMSLAHKYKMKNKLLTVSPCLIDKEIQNSLVLEAMSQGMWITYQNCHLDFTFLLQVHKMIQERSEINKEFRLWLLAEPHQSFPSSITNSSLKVINDSSEDFERKLQDLYHQNNHEYLTSCDHPKFKTLLYVLTFFHCIIQERKKYGPIGWNGIYDFGISEYKISVNTIQTYLKNTKIGSKEEYNYVPWNSLRFIIGEIVYGSQVMDPYDRRTIHSYLEEYFGDFLFDSPQQFRKDKKMLFDILKHEYIGNFADGKEIPKILDVASILGLSSNAELKHKEIYVRKIWEELSATSFCKGSDPETSKQQIVMGTLNKILQVLPKTFNIKELEKANNVPPCNTPTHVVLIQELERFNKSINQIYQNSSNLMNAIIGKFRFDEDMEEIFQSLYYNELPHEWRILIPETRKTLSNWLLYLLERLNQYEKWIYHGHILPVMWLSGLHKPQSLLVALMQEASRKMEIPLENLIFDTNITNEFDHNKIHDPPKLGFYVKGLFLEGAGWDYQKKLLRSSKPYLESEMLPLMLISPIEKLHFKFQNLLKTPVYTTTLRNSSGSGLVFEVELKTAIHRGICILRGICLLLNND